VPVFLYLSVSWRAYCFSVVSNIRCLYSLFICHLFMCLCAFDMHLPNKRQLTYLQLVCTCSELPSSSVRVLRTSLNSVGPWRVRACTKLTADRQTREWQSFSAVGGDVPGRLTTVSLWSDVDATPCLNPSSKLQGARQSTSTGSTGREKHLTSDLDMKCALIMLTV